MARPLSSWRRLATLAPGLLSLTLGTAGCRPASGPAEVPERRPIVVISVDTLRSDRLPVYGYRDVETPAIDALRRDAILFERAYSPVPLTLPAHASLFTGLLPPQHGVRDNIGYRLAEDAGSTLAEHLRRAGYATGGAISAFVMRAETGLARGFDFYDDRLKEAPEASAAEIQRQGGETLEAALEWLDTVRGRPWFLFLHVYEPHTPWEPPIEIATRYGRTYDGEVAAADVVVGRLLAALRARGLYDGSTVLFLSDHGEGLGDHGEEEHGILLYRESLQVPLVLKLPGGRLAGTMVRPPVQLVDVLPTVLDLAGVKLAEELPGDSLLRYTSSEWGLSPDDRPLYAETFYPRLRFGWSGLTSVIVGRYHYIEGVDRELFDLVADPAERHDLLPGERQALARLRHALRGFESRLQLPYEEEEETRRALTALGYLAGTTGQVEGELPDPRRMVARLRPLHEGMSRLREGRDAEAAALLREAVEVVPRSVDAWQFLALAHQRTGELEEAYAAYRRAFELSNGSPRLAYPMAQVALHLARWEEAAALLTLSVEHRPAAIDRRLLLSRALLFAGRPGDALAAALAAAEMAPENADARYQVGTVQMGLRELEHAEAELRRALELAPQHIPALNDLAVLVASQGRIEESRALLERLLRIEPDNREAHEMLTRLTRRPQS